MLIRLAEILYRTKHPIEISASASGTRRPAPLRKASLNVDMDARWRLAALRPYLGEWRDGTQQMIGRKKLMPIKIEHEKADGR